MPSSSEPLPERARDTAIVLWENAVQDLFDDPLDDAAEVLADLEHLGSALGVDLWEWAKADERVTAFEIQRLRDMVGGRDRA